MLFRSPVVRFFSRILNRITITVVLVALQLLWLCWVAFAITTGTVSYTHLTLPTIYSV